MPTICSNKKLVIFEILYHWLALPGHWITSKKTTFPQNVMYIYLTKVYFYNCFQNIVRWGSLTTVTKCKMCWSSIIYQNRQLHVHKQLSVEDSIVISLLWNKKVLEKRTFSTLRSFYRLVWRFSLLVRQILPHVHQLTFYLYLTGKYRNQLTLTIPKL